jgi:hypothetical protein
VPPLENGYDSTDTEDKPLVLPDPPKDAGSPNGTTKEKKRQDIVSIKLCTDAIVAIMFKESTDRKAEGKKIAKDFLDSVIKAKKKNLT